jgi:hypothetical protein
MRLEISAKDLPNHLGKTIYLHDEESKKDEVISNIQFVDGWIQGHSVTNTSTIGIGLNYKLTKIFIEV